MRRIVLGLVTSGYDKAKKAAGEVVGLVKFSRDLTKEQMRELRDAARETRAQAQLLSRTARERQVVVERPEATDFSAARQVVGKGKQAVELGKRAVGVAQQAAGLGSVSGALGIGASLANAIPGVGPIVAAALTTAVIPLLNELRRERELARQDDRLRTEVLVAEQLRTFEERIKADPDFAYIAARQASREIAEDEARGDRGFSESTRGLLGDE